MYQSYGGKRVSGGTEVSHLALRLAWFPALLFYQEFVLHVYMKLELAYLPVYLLFSIAAGLLLDALTTPFPVRTNRILSKVFTVVICLVYIIEIIAKKILQSYYPLSTLGLAAGNRLTDYSDVVVSMLVESIPIIILTLLPAVAAVAFGNRVVQFVRMDARFSVLLALLALVFHLLGVGSLYLPWKGDLTPKQLYQVDTNIDDQVEQLGLWTMLRLDLKHQIIPARNDLGDDFSDLSVAGGGADSSSQGEGSQSGSSSQGTQEPVIDTSPNVMDVDLAGLAQSTDNGDVAWLANYFNSVTPTNKNEYTGMFKGYNVILFVLEGFSGYAIDPELTPTLYKMANEGFVFHNYYTALHFTSTSNGECQTLLGLYPKNGNPSTLPETGELGTNCYFSLAQQLGRAGYQVLGYHGNYNMYRRNLSHPNLGYLWKQYEYGFDNLELSSDGSLLWPQRDKYVIDASVDDYINSDEPFHVYYLTISGHTPYSKNRVASQYQDLVADLPYSDTTKNYVASAAIEVDRAMAELLSKLEAAGKLDNTLIVATGDHIPYADVEVLEELAGKQFGSSDDLEYLQESAIDFDVYKNTLIMWSGSMEEPVEVDKVCCQVDILPTVSNLLGLEYDSRMLSGTDIFSQSEGLVIFTSQSWRSDKGFYNRYTQTFTPAEGVSMTQEEQDAYVSAMKKLVSYRLGCTEKILNTDFYNLVFGNKFVQEQ